MDYEAVIFDNDGVLTHPTPSEVVRDAVQSTFREFGVDPAEHHVDAMVNSDLDGIAEACREHGIDPDEFWRQREANSAAAQRTLLESGEKPLYDDVGALHDLDRDLAVVSNNQHATVEHIIDVYDLHDVFPVAYGRDPSIDGVRRKKPEPHYLECAMRDLAVEDVLYVGDSNVDILAADEAGVDSAFIHRPHREDYDLAADPTYELGSLADLHDITR